MKKTFIQSLIGTLLLFGLTAKAAEIKGVIICKDKAVSFANITILATKIGTQADEDGKFIIKNAPNGKQTIQISMFKLVILFSNILIVSCLVL